VFEATRDNFQSDPSLQQAETQKPWSRNQVSHGEAVHCFPDEQSPKKSTQLHFVTSFQILPIESEVKFPTFDAVAHMHSLIELRNFLSTLFVYQTIFSAQYTTLALVRQSFRLSHAWNLFLFWYCSTMLHYYWAIRSRLKSWYKEMHTCIEFRRWASDSMRYWLSITN
jgi:hypothetical protein